ncbi:hypothetical protein [Tissierella sp.]|uniref:hypothetical protein n=1 Tax=Tissierella sp. TaxID=41274 RepID=UPI00286DA9A5|nr:hypothetical protein [Tissierella sp.]
MGVGWFKSANNDQSQQDSADQQFEIGNTMNGEQPPNPNEMEQADAQNNNPLFSKENQDKVVLDAIVSLENMLKDRQLILYKNNGLVDKLEVANETINRIKQDLMKKEQLLQEKIKEIHGLESSLTSKQMSYDQLLEDYKEYQNNSNVEYETISNQLDTEINKYNKLNEESMNAQYQSMIKISNLEEVIRSLETENQQYVQQYQKILDEKSELMKTINDFTERMSFSFSTRTSSSSSSDSK